MTRNTDSRPVRRREMLRTAGAGLTLGGTLGVAGGEPVTGRRATDTRVTTPEHTSLRSSPVVTTFTATATSGRIAIDTDDPETVTTFTADDFPDGRDAVVSFDGELLRSGVWRTESVSVVDLVDVLRAFDTQQLILDAIEAIDIETTIEETSLEDALAALVGVIERLDFEDPDSDRVQSVRTTLDEFVQAVTDEFATSVPLSILESVLFTDVETEVGPDAPQSIDELLVDPSVAVLSVMVQNLEDAFDLLFDTDVETGRSTADSTDTENSDDPTLEGLVDRLLDLLEFDSVGEIETMLVGIIADFDAALIDESFSQFAATVHPGRLVGTFDPRGVDDGDVHVQVAVETATLSPDIPGIILGQRVDPAFYHPAELDFDLGMSFTSGQSGTRHGSVELVDEGERAILTLVDNTFTVEAEGIDVAALLDGFDLNELIDLAIDLDIIGFLASELDVDLPEPMLDAVGDLILDINITRLAGALGIEQMLADSLTDEPGRHVLEFDVEFEFRDPVDLDGLADGLPSEPLRDGGDPPQDDDGDGLFENLTGSEDAPTVTDVQVLFDAMGEIPDSQTHFYNFAGVNDDRVTIFDVQALFRRATASNSSHD